MLFGPPGIAYVYRSYGIHAMLNAVCEPEGEGAAVLIRALEPLEGLDAMRSAPRAHAARRPLLRAPGKLTQALGIELDSNDTGPRAHGPIRIHGPAPGWEHVEVVVGPRIGITKAAELPWRFCARARAASRVRGRRACARVWAA